jgi:hypothetical protein
MQYFQGSHCLMKTCRDWLLYIFSMVQSWDIVGAGSFLGFEKLAFQSFFSNLAVRSGTDLKKF